MAIFTRSTAPLAVLAVCLAGTTTAAATSAPAPATVNAAATAVIHAVVSTIMRLFVSCWDFLRAPVPARTAPDAATPTSSAQAA